MLFQPDIAETVQSAPVSLFRNDVLAGLSSRPRAIPARWLYDAAGCALFETITTLPEYYPTRTETLLLDHHIAEIANVSGRIGTVIEFGAGSATKTPVLLNALRPACYVPIDVAGEALNDAAARLAAQIPELEILPVEADFLQPISLPGALPGRRLGFFPGSTIGNFAPAPAIDLLRSIRDALGPDSMLLIGIDRVKDGGVLIPAYDDAAGVTARFNINLLHRINRELDGDIPIDNFHHRIVWNDRASRIEMHLEADAHCNFTVARRNFTIAAGETIHTENSYKYGLRDAHLLLSAGNWRPVAQWVDPQGLFMLILACAETPAAAP